MYKKEIDYVVNHDLLFHLPQALAAAFGRPDSEMESLQTKYDTMMAEWKSRTEQLEKEKSQLTTTLADTQANSKAMKYACVCVCLSVCVCVCLLCMCFCFWRRRAN